MPIDKAFKGKINDALNNENMRKALDKFGREFPTARAKIYEGIDFENLRTQIAQVKGNAINDFEKLADQFQANLEKRGAHFHHAKDGQEVFACLKKIAQDRNAKICVKSKSMASEEIHLNKHMADTMEMVETDLGEWIIQQIGEKPSHMVMPAIHLTKERCAEIFSNTLKIDVDPSNIENMVKLARKTLREKFLTADIGISGCNIAVAETGTMCIFTNEGNARLTSTMPPVHVVLVGYEKLVEKFQDIAPITKALAKSATAQAITSYVTMITGPVETFKDNVGPEVVTKELHVILLDNGRKEFLKDPVFKEIGQCLRCGSCINVCPVYQLLSGHVYGHIYPGGIGSLLTAFLDGYNVAEQPQELCIGCGRCKEVCPGNIDIPGLVLELRNRIRKQIPLTFIPNFIVGSVLPNRNLFHFGLRQASWASAPFVKKGSDDNKFIRSLPFGFSKLSSWRSLPSFSSKPFRDRIKNMEQDIEKKKGKIAFFGGCVIDFAYPEIGESLVEVLNKLGYEIEYPEQGCCGLPAFYMGRQDVARKMAKENIAAFLKEDYDYIVSACPSCTVSLKEHWKELLKDDQEYGKKAKIISEKVVDFIKLVDILGIEEVADKFKTGKAKITYHDSCHLNRELGVKEEPRRVLKSLKNIDFVEMNESETCCGFGGSYCIKFPEISTEILERKLANAKATKADIIVVDCPGCLMQLRGGLDTKGIKDIKVKHSAEIIDGEF